MQAGTMMFIFEKAQCAHAQYLPADTEYSSLNLKAFIYYKMAEQYSGKGVHYLSCRTTTEHGRETINLLRYKDGSIPSIAEEYHGIADMGETEELGQHIVREYLWKGKVKEKIEDERLNIQKNIHYKERGQET